MPIRKKNKHTKPKKQTNKQKDPHTTTFFIISCVPPWFTDCLPCCTTCTFLILSQLLNKSLSVPSPHLNLESCNHDFFLQYESLSSLTCFTLLNILEIAQTIFMHLIVVIILLLEVHILFFWLQLQILTSIQELK